MESDASLTLENTVDLTAECQEMWGGIYVRSNSRGIVSNNGPFVVGGNNDAYINNSLRHNHDGIVLEKTEPDVSLHLRGLNFQHCYRGITFGRCAQATDYILGCTFDSDPDRMNAPFKFQSSIEN